MMISCNNHQRVLARYPRYGLRKPGVGVASVLLSTSFWLGMTSNVRADTNPTPAGTQANSGVGVPANDQQQPLTNAASNPAAASAAATSTSKSLTPTRSIKGLRLSIIRLPKQRAIRILVIRGQLPSTWA